jgi:superfamily II DNA or RNA helicase
MRVIYHGEKLGKWDTLLDIVTGWGKTVIMATLIAYFRQVRGYTKFLILVPGTIVRERVKDDFEPRNPGFAYRDFPLFFPPHTHIPERLVTRVLRERSDSASIKDADIIIANIHQLYENKASETLEQLLADNITPDLVIFNDEAHNAAAMQYREVLKLLKRKTVARIDLTATPYRLDKQDLDTYPPIYEYHIQQAMKDGVVKQIVVTKPDIKSVKLQYEEWDDENKLIRTLDADEMPWEQIEAELKNSGAVKFVTAKNARRQQLQIAEANLDYQKKCIPRDHEGNPLWTPLMLVVALSQKDALQVYETLTGSSFGYKSDELLLVHSKQDEIENKKAFLLSRKGKEWLSAEDVLLWEKTRKIKVIIAVSMLREWWDVKNISVICLFRKFSYQKKWDQIHTVYGPQIIGRGLRKIRPVGERDLLFVIDHPAFDHKWLWEMLSATEYQTSFNPGDTIDEEKIDDIPKKTTNTQIPDEEDWKEKEEIDITDILSWIPTPADIVIIADWKKHFMEFNFQTKISSAHQNITNIKSNSLVSGNTAHVDPEIELSIEELNAQESIVRTWDREKAIKTIIADIEEEPHRILMTTYKSETAKEISVLTDAILWILGVHFSVSNIESISTLPDEILQKMLFCLPQIFDELKDPSIIPAILSDYDTK